MNHILNRALYWLLPAAFWTLCAVAANSGMHADGIVIGKPRNITRVVYVERYEQDPRLMQLADAIEKTPALRAHK